MKKTQKLTLTLSFLNDFFALREDKEDNTPHSVGYNLLFADNGQKVECVNTNSMTMSAIFVRSHEGVLQLQIFNLIELIENIF